MKIYDVFDLDTMKGNLYLMSDLHLGHQNAIRFGNRPFTDYIEMKEAILKEMKEKLTPDDVLFDLGDMFWETKGPDCEEFLKQIEVKQFYKAIGNHDKESYYYSSQPILAKRFTKISDLFTIRVRYQRENYRAVLCHFPLLEWNHDRRGSMMIHGHSHGKLDELNESVPDLRVDVGYDSMMAKRVGSFLIPFSEIITYFKEKTGGTSLFDWASRKYDHETPQNSDITC